MLYLYSKTHVSWQVLRERPVFFSRKRRQNRHRHTFEKLGESNQPHQQKHEQTQQHYNKSMLENVPQTRRNCPQKSALKVLVGGMEKELGSVFWLKNMGSRQVWNYTITQMILILVKVMRFKKMACFVSKGLDSQKANKKWLSRCYWF